MYAIIHRHKRLAVIIIAVASLSFLFWMFSVSDVRQMFGLKGCVAEVNGECISLREFRYELLRYSDLLQKDELKDTVKRQVLYSLVNQEVLYQKALELGIRTSSGEIAESIKNDPNFERNGRFDMETYKSLLERVELTPSEYEHYLRKRLTVRKLVDLISSMVYLTDEEVGLQEGMFSTKFSGRVYLISTDSLSIDYKPSDEEVERFYRENRDRFLIPERRVYLLWKTDSKERAHSMYASLKGGNLPEGGREIGDEGELPREVLGELKRLSKDERFTITKVGDSYYILYLKELKPEGLRPLSEVRSEVVEMLRRSKAEEMAEKKALEVKERLGKGEKVNTKLLEFTDASVEQLLSLFKIRDEELLRMVFSKDKVFGPYRVQGGFAVLELEGRKVEKGQMKDIEGLDRDLGEAKREALIKMFLEKLVGSAKVRINEEYLK